MDRIKILEYYDDWEVHSPSITMKVPALAITKDYHNFSKGIRFSRQNLYVRDLFQCQYCSETFDYHELNIDHVIPLSKGGKTNWENCVTSCKSCNSRKGSSTNIKPRMKPYKPDYYSLVGKWKDIEFTVRQESWNQYLGINDQVAA